MDEIRRRCLRMDGFKNFAITRRGNMNSLDVRFLNASGKFSSILFGHRYLKQVCPGPVASCVNPSG